MELDSHTDTVLGSNCVVLHHTGKVCEVSLYSDEYEAIIDVPVVHCATLWTDTIDNQEYILIFNKALWMGSTLSHTLINPNQLCEHGMLVQDNPFASSPLAISLLHSDILIPLHTLGTVIYTDTRAPNLTEIATLPHLVLTSDADWDLHNVQFPSHHLEEEIQHTTINVIKM